MPFYIKKSVSVGPFRFNLSKSGIGISAGVKGFRIGSGPRGNYIHMGRGGLYYRASLPYGHTTRSPGGPPEPVPIHESSDSLATVETGEILEMTDSNGQDVLGQINEKLGMLPLWPFVLVPGLIAASLLYAHVYAVMASVVLLVVILASVLAAYFDRIRRTVVLIYDLDEECSNAFETLTKSLDLLSETSAIWNIDAQGRQADWKRHAGATTSVTRARVTVGYKTPRVINTNISVPAIIGGRQNLYFLPDLLLVLEGRTAGGVSYDHLNITAGTTNFIESERVPSDAQIVNHTWKYVNKSGGPDRRFNNNKQLPVVRYQELDFTSTSGLQKLLHVSRSLDRSGLLQAAMNLGTIVQAARSTSAHSDTGDGRFVHSKHSSSSALPLLLVAGVGAAILASSILLVTYHGSSAQYSPPATDESPKPVSTSSAPEQLNENAKLQLEKKLLSKARAIPATDYEANLNAYQRLAELRPESHVYERKVERYRSLLETQQNTEGSLRRFR